MKNVKGNDVKVVVVDEVKKVEGGLIEMVEDDKLEGLLLEIERLNKLIKENVGNKDGRKGEIFNILKEGKISIEDISKRVGISSRNVSSILSYLRKDFKDGKLLVDGKKIDGIGKNSKGCLYLELEG